MAAGSYLPMLDCYFVLETDMEPIRNLILTSMGTSGTQINNKLNGSLELLLGRKVMKNNTVSFTFLTTPKFHTQCDPLCGKLPGESTPMYNAIVRCADGVDFLHDYRNKPVLAAYICLPSIGAGRKFYS